MTGIHGNRKCYREGNIENLVKSLSWLQTISDLAEAVAVNYTVAQFLWVPGRFR
jgi:hypothetical protein